MESLSNMIVEIQQGWKQIGIRFLRKTKNIFVENLENIPICFQPCWISTIIFHNDSKAYNIYDSTVYYEKIYVQCTLYKLNIRKLQPLKFRNWSIDLSDRNKLSFWPFFYDKEMVCTEIDVTHISIYRVRFSFVLIWNWNCSLKN